MMVQSSQPRRPSTLRHIRIWQKHPQPFSKVITNWRFLLVLVALLVFTNWLGHRWLFERGALAGTDVLLRAPKAVPAKHCRLITIDEQEFDSYLGEWLQPEKLEAVLRTVLEYEPKVLVVDIDTSAPRFRKMGVPASDSTKTKIVWARVSHEALRTTPGERGRTYAWSVGAVLRQPQPKYVGSPLFVQDPDSTVRGFQRVLQVDADTPALYWVALRAYCESDAKGGTDAQRACELVKLNQPSDEHKGRSLHVDWEFLSYPLSDLMSSGGSTKPRKGELGDIVLLGASFSDIHSTPFGPRLGIELTGSAIESELSESEPRLISGWTH